LTATELTIWIPGTPAPQGSLKAVRRGSHARLVSDNKRTMPWRETIRTVLRASGHGHELLDCPVYVSLAFYFERLKSHYGKRGLSPSAPFAPTTKPDLDKLVRAVGDALTGVVLWDDSRIVDVRARKHYVDFTVRTEPGLLLSVQPLDRTGCPVRWDRAGRRDARTGSVVQ
jgi:crossover junction endodeoxyribonuclease RusA